MLATEVSIETRGRLYETDNHVKQKLYVLAKSNSIGDRLIEAFETDDKEFIAKKLGFGSKQGVYKVLSGERELDFEKLQNFRNYTKCSIDWLLTGEGPKEVGGPRYFDIDAAIDRHDAWQPILEDWYEFEGKQMPDLMGASFMNGWDSFDRDIKISALRDLKRVLDTHVE